MVTKKFVSDTIKKSVMTSEGTLLGTVSNYVMDTESGAVKTLLVKPVSGSKYAEFQTDKEGRYMIPLRQVKSLKDVFVVETNFVAPKPEK
ncbi:MAG: PRC-barrel domain-containing protein [Candidatus Thermoplasmatota archaeon]|nr:PRC-barrel domain-containing protein [Candidatus Thermoplasmatota archaeon]